MQHVKLNDIWNLNNELFTNKKPLILNISFTQAFFFIVEMQNFA